LWRRRVWYINLNFSTILVGKIVNTNRTMRYRLQVILAFICTISMLTIYSCSDTNKNKDKEIANPEFAQFLRKFPSLSYPVTINGCLVNLDSLAKLSGEKYLPEDAFGHAYGIVPASDEYVCVILLAQADCEIPVILTFDKNGNKIDEQAINIGYCGFDCGYTCRESMLLGSNNEIYTADTITSYECDSLGNPVPGTNEHYVIYKTGKILSSGKIELSKEMRKDL